MVSSSSASLPGYTSLVQLNYTQFALRTHNGQIKGLVWHAATEKGFKQSTGTLQACLPKQHVSK